MSRQAKSHEHGRPVNRVLVTGGAGFIGSHVVDTLVQAGLAVRVLDSLHPAAHDGHPGYLNPGAEYRWADLRDGDTVAAALDGVDAVCHQAAMVGLGVDFADAPDYVAHNCGATAVLLSALYQRRSCGRLILASSMAVYGDGLYRCPEHGTVRPGPRRREHLAVGVFDPPCPACGRPLVSEAVGEEATADPRNVYAATKLHQEHLCAAFARETGSAAVFLRYHNVYGPRMPRDTPYAGVASIFRSALEGGRPPRVFEDGGQRRDFVHVADVARANLLALIADPPPEGPLNVASGQPHTVLDMAFALTDAFGPKAPAPVVTGEFRLGDVRHVVASPHKARDALGFTAEVTFPEGMAEFARAPLRSSGGTPPWRRPYSSRSGPAQRRGWSSRSMTARETRLPAIRFHADAAVTGIPLVAADQAPLLARPYYEAGDPGPIAAALAHVPELLDACLPFLATVFGPTALPARTKEMVILRTSALLGCRYCVESHSVAALDAGLTPDEVQALCGEEPGIADEAAEVALVAWVDAVAGRTGPVDAGRREALAPHFTDAEVVEITLLVGVTLMLNRFCTALGLPTSTETRRRLAEAGLS
jgi:dTDP-L-rhamnose 4-epimerase